ncbi:putative integral membrane zinc-ribbon metal-binding protein [Carex littledalei]|uniref:Putative integral membrane zinc-ribbon metal-binding protein n=1 Tax=Carex littledalei TaxID=544730 RepID=A0A833VT63_9POAL|nr:putative integral membrane zinc-ribbon metal-binding protein [Carex littledalei]
MADDRIPEPVEEREEDDEEQEDDCTSSDRDRNSDAHHGEEEESSGYFSRMLHKKIGGDDLEMRIEVIDKEEESLESRMVIRERTAEQVNRTMIFLSVNLEFVAGIYAYLRIRSRNLSWKGRAIRILPMFLVPVLSSFFYSLFSRFTSMLNLRDSRLLERLRKEREAKIQELKERANYYMAKRHIQNGHGESSSTASSLGSNLPGTSDTRDKTVNYNLLLGKSRQLHPDTSTDLDACKSTVNDENGKKKLRSLIICSNCRMHNGFARRDELQFISYKCPHCNALNGPNKEQKGSDSASTSGEGAPQSQPYNPFSMQEMPRGIFIEEITPNHETTDPEMDHPIMIIRESPSLGGREELPSAFTPVTLRKLPSGLSIEEMTSNEERTAAEMEPPVLIIPESPAAVTPLMVPETARGLSIEEISPNDQQIEDHDVITPVVFVQEPPSASGQVELLSSQNSGTVTPVTIPEMPSGLSIVEMTPNQETTDPEMEPPVMIIRESPSAGAPVMGDSSFITPLMVQEMGSGLSIEEVSSNHQLIDDREMNPPVMFVQESPSLGSQELSMSTPDPAAATSVTVPEMAGFSIEELSPNQRGNEDSQTDPPVMIVQESPSVGGPSTVTPLEVPEPLDDTINPDGSVRSPNDSVNWSTPGSSTITGSSGRFQDLTEIGQEEVHDNDVPGSSDNESLDADGPHGSVTIPEMPSGLSIVEMTPNQETTDPEMEPPVMIIRESPSAGAPVMGDSSFITPLMVQEMASGLSIEEVSPNHQLTHDCGMDPPVMFVQESPSLGSQELSMSTLDPAAATSVTVPEMPGFSIEELSPNQNGNEDCQTDPPVMIVQESPSVGGPPAVTPLEVPEPLDDTINPDGSVRSPNDSVNWSTPGSSTITGSSGRFQDLTEIGQEEVYDNDVPGSSDNESLDADGPHGSVNATGVTGKESLTASHLPSENESGIDYSTGGNYESDSSSWRYVGSDSVARNTVTVAEIHPGMGENLQSESQHMDVHEMNVTHPDTDFNSSSSESETDSDYGSVADVNEEEATQDLETRDTDGGVPAGSSATDSEQNSRNAEEQNELFTSAYDDSMDTDNDFMGSSAVNGDEEQWSNWQQSEPVMTAGTHPLEETHLIDGEMPPTEVRDEVEELEAMQQEDYTGHDDPNPVGWLAYDRDKGSASQISRKGVGGMKTDNVIQDKMRREGERVEEISDKEGSVKNQGIKPEPVAKASGVLLSHDPGLDPQSIPFTGIASSPAPQWGTDTDFEPPRAVGLRHRK